MFERDGRVGGADVAQLLFQCHVRMNGPVSHAASPPMQVHETMHLACADGASLAALPAIFELMPTITLCQYERRRENDREGTVYTLTTAATRL